MMSNVEVHRPDTQVSELAVEHLCVSYTSGDSVVEAVRDVTFSVKPGEILGIVGESGSGKSSVAQALLRLLPDTATLRGRIVLGGDDLVQLDETRLRSVRGSRIGMIFQDASTALNPVYTIRTLVVDTIRRHRPGLSRRAARDLAARTIEEMGIPGGRLDSYPHQLSGGMRQRALIATAMVAEPSFLVADEPTSDLDTISQAQILALLRTLRDERNVGMVFISHDLSVVASLCDHLAVMYHGEVVELGPAAAVFAAPKHPYTQHLLRVSRKERDSNGRFLT